MYILTGLGVHQSKSDASPDGIIMNSAKETEDSGNTALADGSTDKNAEQQRSVGDVIRPIISSIQPQQQRQQIEPSKYQDREEEKYVSMEMKIQMNAPWLPKFVWLYSFL